MILSLLILHERQNVYGVDREGHADGHDDGRSTQGDEELLLHIGASLHEENAAKAHHARNGTADSALHDERKEQRAGKDAQNVVRGSGFLGQSNDLVTHSQSNSAVFRYMFVPLEIFSNHILRVRVAGL